MKISAHRVYGFLTLVWIAVILLLTLTPAVDMPVTPAWKLISFDTAAHAGVFAVLAALSWLWRRGRRGPAAGRAAGLVLAGCVAFGGTIELLQYAMHQGRHAEWSDLLSDTIGVVVALGLLLLLRRRPAVLAAAGLLALALPLRAQPARPTEPDLARVRRTIAVLASEKMSGRGYVRQGEHRAATYLRGRLRQLGLRPLAPDYTQPFTLDVNTFPGPMSLRLALAKAAPTSVAPREVALRPGIDFIAAPACPSVGPKTYYLAYPDTLAYQDARAASPELLLGRPDPAYGTALLVRAQDEARLHQPANASLAARYAADPHLDIVPKLTASLAAGQAKHAQLEVLATSLPGWATSNQTLVTLQVEARLIHDYPTQNLAAVVRGRTQPDSFLVVSAHYDHLGTMGKNVYFPGANDNASGVALLLELAAHYARPENQPACSVAFLLFGAEEAGLVGSTYFVRHPLLPLAGIKFLLNLDLLGTGEEGATIVNGRTYPAAYQRLLALNDSHHYLPRLTARGPAANSDHYPFSAAGVPAFFMYTRGGSPAYHDVHDQPAALSLAGFAGAFGLARDFLNAEGAQ